MSSRRIVSFAAILLLGQAICASAQDQPRQTDEDACRPDVFRLCAEQIPDEDAIVACLNAKVADLNPACRAVIAPAPTGAARRSGRTR